MNEAISETFIRESLREARYLEFCSDANGVQTILNPILSDFASRQNRTANSELGCELLLVYGSAISYQGLTKKEKYLQEKALDFLTEARQFAFETGEQDLIGECEKQIGLCYWRLGQHDNALCYFETALARYSAEEQGGSVVCLATEIYRIGIYFDLRKIQSAEELIDRIKPLIDKSDDHWLQLKFYTEAAGIYLQMDDYTVAVPFIEKAIALAKITRNFAALANGLNNLALVYLMCGRAVEALDYIEKAIEVFSELEQTFTLGMAMETKSRILIALGDFKGAREAIDQSIALLGKSENYLALAESLWKRIEILAASGEKLVIITTDFIRLMETVRNHLSEETINRYVEKFTRLFYLAPPLAGNYYEKMENYRKHLIENALAKSGATVTGVAKNLGISHQNVSLLLRKYPDLCEKYKVKIRKRTTNCLQRKKKEGRGSKC